MEPHYLCGEIHSTNYCPRDAKASGLRHPCFSCITPTASIVIMHKRDGEEKKALDGTQYKYCRSHWDFMMAHSPAGIHFEIELL